mgnify:CR=1 FL=1
MLLPKGKALLKVLILNFPPNFYSTPGLQLIFPSCILWVNFRHKNAAGIANATSAWFINYYARIVC